MGYKLVEAKDVSVGDKIKVNGKVLTVRNIKRHYSELFDTVRLEFDTWTAERVFRPEVVVMEVVR